MREMITRLTNSAFLKKNLENRLYYPNIILENAVKDRRCSLHCKDSSSPVRRQKLAGNQEKFNHKDDRRQEELALTAIASILC